MYLQQGTVAPRLLVPRFGWLRLTIRNGAVLTGADAKRSLPPPFFLGGALEESRRLSPNTKTPKVSVCLAAADSVDVAEAAEVDAVVAVAVVVALAAVAVVALAAVAEAVAAVVMAVAAVAVVDVVAVAEAVVAAAAELLAA
jgi:hypothetical protein